MTGRQSYAVDQAVKYLRRGLNMTQAAAKAGISPSSLYRACKRLGLPIVAGKLKLPE